MEKQDEKKLLNTLKSIDGTLKRIERILKEFSAKKDDELIQKILEESKKCGKSPI